MSENEAFKKYDFTVKSDKKLFYFDKEIYKLPRMPSDILKDDDYFYVITRTGDCFKINKETLNVEFLFGIINKPKHCKIFEYSLGIEDELNRVFIYNKKGKLLDILFNVNNVNKF
ncbi:hypothetical protein HERIO_1357 [Hepatospora eriocheir]|uniref:Uncharacterized protein n=1 Tax=Hepatospora eriocheir TaxID=1081669 RepID=A0A1X0QAA5_9MICR|nr:hypothetical protein HERIO_1357 [Hepatospora eriocheir]